jgi:hypothetical protein
VGTAGHRGVDGEDSSRVALVDVVDVAVFAVVVENPMLKW